MEGHYKGRQGAGEIWRAIIKGDKEQGERWRAIINEECLKSQRFLLFSQIIYPYV